jgi:pectate lyase
MEGISEDGVAIREGTQNVWVDHVTFRDAGDELLYIGSHGGAPTSGITVSWNHFIPGGSDMAILVSDPSTPQDKATTITFHHNHYDQTYVRHPLARYATMHAFNNYYDKNEIGAQIRSEGKFYSENEIFEAPYANPYPSVTADSYADETTAANIKVVNPWLLNGAKVKEINAGGIFNPASFYSYAAETANEALRAKIVATAGRQNVTLPASCR